MRGFPLVQAEMMSQVHISLMVSPTIMMTMILTAIAVVVYYLCHTLYLTKLVIYLSSMERYIIQAKLFYYKLYSFFFFAVVHKCFGSFHWEFFQWQSKVLFQGHYNSSNWYTQRVLWCVCAIQVSVLLFEYIFIVVKLF